MAKENTPKLAGVVGWPVAHSLSPLIHTIWARRAGVKGYYIPIAIEPDYDAFVRAMKSLRTIGFEGVNITIPHKEHALRYADEASDAARTAGAANMLTFEDRKTWADNSDIYGFAESVKDKAVATGGTAVLLGAGGAARGVAIALKNLGFSDILVTNRTRSRAQAFAEQFALTLVDWNDRSDAAREANLIVNTTSLGMTGQPPLELELSRVKPDACIADIVYSPLETPLLAAARKMNRRTIDGLAMLMHQAAPGFRTWFEAEAVVDDDLRRHLVNEFNRRRSE